MGPGADWSVCGRSPCLGAAWKRAKRSVAMDVARCGIVQAQVVQCELHPKVVRLATRMQQWRYGLTCSLAVQMDAKHILEKF